MLKFISAGTYHKVHLYDDSKTYSDGEDYEAFRTDGHIRIDAAPVENYHAVNKAYVDGLIGLWEEDGDGDLQPKA